MSPHSDDRIADYLRLLRQANLTRGEDLLRLRPTELRERLAAASREAAVATPLPDEALLFHLIGIAELKGNQEITAGDLREAAERAGEAPGVSPPAPEDFGISGQVSHGVGSATPGGPVGSATGRFSEEAGLPGENDFDPWPRTKDRNL